MKGRANKKISWNDIKTIIKNGKSNEGQKEMGETIDPRDCVISIYIEWLTTGIADSENLIGRIIKEGVARLEISDFHKPFELLTRYCFERWVDDIDGIQWATEKSMREYNLLFVRYSKMILALSQTIRKCTPDNPQTKPLANAIERLLYEVRAAIDRGEEKYRDGEGKQQATALLSDARHGALWDNVENAVAALSAVQAEKIAVKQEVKAEMRRAHKRGKEKMDAAAIRQEQREAAAKWVKAEIAAGRNASVRYAARQYAAEIEAEKDKGGYKNVEALAKALNYHAAELGIDQFIDHSGKRGRPRKGEAKPRK